MSQEAIPGALGGVEFVTLVFGFIGAALGISYMPPMTRKEQFFALGSGLACAGLLPNLIPLIFTGIGFPAVAAALQIGVVKSALGFVLGILGMFIVPGIIVFGIEFKLDPIGAIKWLVGKGSRPSTMPKSPGQV